MKIYCCGCDKKIEARLTNGEEIYPHRNDLYRLPFWICDICKNFVGCHYKTKDRTRPLGCIPTPELKLARQRIHKILDPIWKSGRMKRNEIYLKITKKIGWKLHVAKIRNTEEAKIVYLAVKEYYP